MKHYRLAMSPMQLQGAKLTKKCTVKSSSYGSTASHNVSAPNVLRMAKVQHTLTSTNVVTSIRAAKWLTEQAFSTPKRVLNPHGQHTLTTKGSGLAHNTQTNPYSIKYAKALSALATSAELQARNTPLVLSVEQVQTLRAFYVVSCAARFWQVHM